MSKTKIFLLFFFLIFLAVSSWARELHGRIVRVSDGDTVWVKLDNGNRVKMRIWGIDTPEKFKSKKLLREASRCKVPASYIVHLGKLASERAEELLEGKEVSVRTHGEGRYGRVLGQVFIDGQDFGLKMLEDGYACVYRKGAPPEYWRAQNQARQGRRGLWGEDYKLMECLCF